MRRRELPPRMRHTPMAHRRLFRQGASPKFRLYDFLCFSRRRESTIRHDARAVAADGCRQGISLIGRHFIGMRIYLREKFYRCR